MGSNHNRVWIPVRWEKKQTFSWLYQTCTGGKPLWFAYEFVTLFTSNPTKRWLLHRIVTASHCIGQVSVQFASTTSYRTTMWGAPEDGLSNAILCPYPKIYRRSRKNCRVKPTFHESPTARFSSHGILWRESRKNTETELNRNLDVSSVRNCLKTQQ